MRALWEATDQFAATWMASPHVEPFREGLRPTPTDPANPMHLNSVQQVLATFSLLESQPLLLGKRLPHLPAFGQLHDESPEVQQWLRVAQRFAFVLVEVIEFLRSRLPGYPSLLVPDLMPGATRVYQDGFWDRRFPWETEVRHARLQFRSEPAMLKLALELPDGGRAALSSLTAIADALRESASWTRFVAAHQALTATDREDAKRRRRAFHEAVSEARVDEIAGDTGMRGQLMRTAELHRSKADSTDTLREYYDAFRAVDEVIDAVASLVSHRVAKANISEVGVITADWGLDADLRKLRVRATDDDFRHPYELVRVRFDVTSLSGLMLLHNVTINFGPRMESQFLAADGRLLKGSGGIPGTLHVRSPHR
jgi:hypothetical protein